MIPNFHTHIGRPVLDRDGEPVTYRLGIKGGGRLRIRYEYVPRFSDPGETARAMVMAAARKAKLDARRERMAPRIAATEARRAGIRAAAEHRRAMREYAAVERRDDAVSTGRKGWTLPRRLRGRVVAA